MNERYVMATESQTLSKEQSIAATVGTALDVAAECNGRLCKLIGFLSGKNDVPTESKSPECLFDAAIKLTEQMIALNEKIAEIEHILGA